MIAGGRGSIPRTRIFFELAFPKRIINLCADSLDLGTWLWVFSVGFRPTDGTVMWIYSLWRNIPGVAHAKLLSLYFTIDPLWGLAARINHEYVRGWSIWVLYMAVAFSLEYRSREEILWLIRLSSISTGSIYAPSISTLAPNTMLWYTTNRTSANTIQISSRYEVSEPSQGQPVNT